jgi:DNA-binding beta-propeller fold protein YncE
MAIQTKTFQLKYIDNVGFIADAGGRGFHLPTAMAIASDHRIYVASRSSNEATRPVVISIVTADHQYFGAFSGFGKGDGQMIWPTALACDSNDRLYLADEFLHRITIFDGDGNFIAKWGKHGSAPGEIDAPAGLAFDADDNLFVVDHKNHRVQKFTKDGKYISSFGSYGKGEGQLNLPWGIDVDKQGNVYVADWRNDRIQKFSPDGKFIASFGESGSGDGQFNRPSDVAVDSEGIIYVADWSNQRVQALSPDGTFLTKIRGEAKLNPWAVEYLNANADEKRARASYQPVFELDTDDPHEQSARTESYFWDPVDVNVDENDRLYVLETGRHRFQMYEKV